jgi:hypothetical protein
MESHTIKGDRAAAMGTRTEESRRLPFSTLPVWGAWTPGGVHGAHHDAFPVSLLLVPDSPVPETEHPVWATISFILDHVKDSCSGPGVQGREIQKAGLFIKEKPCRTEAVWEA